MGHQPIDSDFHALYPGKRMILALDNAKYHKARAANYVDPNTMKHTALARAVIDFGCVKMTVERDVAIDDVDANLLRLVGGRKTEKKMVQLHVVDKDK